VHETSRRSGWAPYLVPAPAVDLPLCSITTTKTSSKVMSTSAKISSVALIAIGIISFIVTPTASRADEVAKTEDQKPAVETVAPVVETAVPFAKDEVAVPFEPAPANVDPKAAPNTPVKLPSADEAEAAPADTAAQGGVIYRRLSQGNFIASHYDGQGKLTRRDIYRQPNELVVVRFDANGKVTYRQTFYVWLDVYIREGKFGYQHKWMLELRRLEVFHADGKTHSKVVVFYPSAGPPRTARDINARGGVQAIRQYRQDGSRLSETTYKNGSVSKLTRHTAKENLRETLDPLHVALPTGTVLVDSESDSTK